MHICDNSVFTFRIRKQCIGLSNTYNVDSLNSFRGSVVDKFKSELCILQKGYDSKENNIRIQYANNSI